MTTTPFSDASYFDRIIHSKTEEKNNIPLSERTGVEDGTKNLYVEWGVPGWPNVPCVLP